jgi:haloalkane dehalogenase
VRTPEERFAGLVDFPWPAHYAEVTAPEAPDPASTTWRMAYLDEGDPTGPPVVLLHGEPSWSYLYRHMVGPLVAAGLRVIAPDLIGFGRSDKPPNEEAHTYARHVAWVTDLIARHLDLTGATLFCQDWGGLIGLRVVAENAERFARVCAANTGLPDGSRKLGKAWWGFYDFVRATPDLPIGVLVSGGVARPMDPEVRAAYDAPFPDASYKAGPRSLPRLIPQEPDAPGAADNRAAWTVLEGFDRPFLCLFSDSDPITAGGETAFLDRVPGTKGQPHATIAGGHFLQEDAGAELGRRLVEWMS